MCGENGGESPEVDPTPLGGARPRLTEPGSSGSWRESVDLLRVTVKACEQFEAAWRAGKEPSIDSIIEGLDSRTHSVVITELRALAIELQAQASRPEEMGTRQEPETEAARQLLLGLLAHEYGLIDQRLLLAGYQLWIDQGEDSLGQVLVDQRAITPNRRIAIEEMVSTYLASRGNSVREGLRGLRVSETLRQKLGQISSPSLHGVLAQVQLQGSFAPSNDSACGKNQYTRYQILEPLDEGGMGRVSVALDAQMHRKVALKEIRESAADDAQYRARFLAEAELTGKLEHPGIIPVYSVGQRDDGRPYYAMRLIQGEQTGSLKTALDRFHKTAHGNPSERELQFRGLLGRVVDVCNTIEYAHSQSIIHRDLKPSNILLGPYGETLVVDWGLAKRLDRAATADVTDSGFTQNTLCGAIGSTLHGDTIGTPEYAAPEQISGDLGLIGTGSDIYALGAILYYLLTGTTPYSRRDNDSDILKQKILKGQFLPPHRLKPNIDKALEAICLKAMQIRPGDRYGSAQALKQELELYLAGEPVSAYQEPTLVRCRRWVSQHRTIAASTVVALLAAVLGLAATSAVQIRARTNMELKNQELVAQQEIARQRESLAIEAVKQFREAVAGDPALKNSPALASLRTRLLQKPLVFFQNLQQELERNQDTRPESLVRLAEASSELARLVEELGDYKKAITLQERTALLYGQAIQGTNDAPLSWSIAKADVNFRRATLFRKLGENDKALEGFRHAVEVNQKLLDAFPDNLDLQTQTAAAYNSLATMLARLGRAAEAQPHMEKALAMRAELNQARPDQKEILIALAGSHYNLGLLLSELREQQKSLAEIDKALELYEELVRQDPSDLEIQSSLETCLFHRGFKLFDYGKTMDGIADMEKALALRVKLVQDHPAITEYKYGLLQNYSKLTMKYKQSGQTERAFKTQQPGIQVAEELVKQSPDTPRFLTGLMEQQHENGHLLMLLNRPDEAMKAFDQALASHTKLLAVSNPDPRLLYNHAELLTHLPDLYQNAGDLKSAQSWMKQAIAAHHALTAAGGFPGNTLQPLREYLLELEQISTELGDAETAADARRQLEALPPEQK